MATANQAKLDSGSIDQSPEWKLLFEEELISSLLPNQSERDPTVTAAPVDIVARVRYQAPLKRNWISTMVESKLIQCYGGAIVAYALAIVLGVDIGFASAFLGGSTAMFLSVSVATKSAG